MKKTLLIITAALLLSACGSSDLGEGFEHFDGSDFSFSYPIDYDLKKAATTFIFEDLDGDAVLTMNRYLAESTDEILEQMASVEQICEITSGGERYGGYKSYSVIANDESCLLEGDMVTNKKGMYILFLDENADDELKSALKKSFTFN